MEIGFSPVPPPQAIRRPAEARVSPRNPGEIENLAALSREQVARRPRPIEGERPSPRAVDFASAQAERAEFLQARVQPDLPTQARRALETFVSNSFSEQDDPAAGLGGIDEFV